MFSNYNLTTFNLLSKTLYVAELTQSIELHKIDNNLFLSDDEINLLRKRKHKAKQVEFIFSRYLIKKMAGFCEAEMPLLTVKYCNIKQVAGIFKNKKLIVPLSLSHSGEFIAFSFCAIDEHIGVDIEQIKPRNITSLVEHYFCTEDKIIMQSAVNTSECFYKLWTEKEAVTKLVNTSVFSLLSHSSTELNKQYQLQSIIKDNFVISIACSLD